MKAKRVLCGVAMAVILQLGVLAVVGHEFCAANDHQPDQRQLVDGQQRHSLFRPANHQPSRHRLFPAALKNRKELYEMSS
jgi:hypothetical protein